MKIKRLLIVFLLLANSFIVFATIDISSISLPEGFHIEVIARDIETARGLALSPNGIIFVGSKNGSLYALTDYDKNGTVEERYVIATGYRMPVGVTYRDGDLYFSDIDTIYVLKDIDNQLANPPQPIVVNNTFPDERRHGWKFIKFGPDGMLYVPVGAPCNVCLEDDSRYASIMRMQPDGSSLELYAEGIRNTVGFDWHPETGILWFTDNGRDWMGDDIPPDELNKAERMGLHFGFPFIHGNSIVDPQFGGNRKPEEFIPPEIELGPHVAALGMRFYTGSMFPAYYQNQIFIAEHGSWNRTVPIGYRITLVTLKNGKAQSYKVFAEGWLDGNSSWGRPVDVEVYYDGSLLVSDDTAHAVYRIYYK